MIRASRNRGFLNFVVCAVLLAASHIADAASMDPVIAAYHKMENGHFRTEAMITDDKGKVTNSKAEFETMERIHVTSPRSEIIMLPEGTWMRTGDKWMKPPVDMSALVKSFRPMGEDMLRAATNVTDNGTTTWQGQPAHSYTYDTDTTVMGIHASAHTTVYLSAAGTVLGSESDSEALGRKSHTVQKVIYDEAVRVHAPG